MIRAESLTKFFPTRFGKKYVFRGLDFDLDNHVNVGILGRNGAGKTTLINMIAGIETPSSGQIYKDESISWPLGLGSAYQNSMSGYQNARFVCRIHGCSGRELDEAVAFVKAFSELGDYFNMPLGAYSSGMRARLGFALSMVFQFETLLIDEAMAPGDPPFRQKANKALEERREQCRVIMVSHNLVELYRTCQAGIVVGGGEGKYYPDFNDALFDYAGEEVFESVVEGKYRPSAMRLRKVH